MTYKTEMEARLHYVAKFMRYTGTTEGSDAHRELVEDYNRIRPLPRGYAAKMSDDWCALSRFAPTTMTIPTGGPHRPLTTSNAITPTGWRWDLTGRNDIWKKSLTH